jgi:hypothetical protein
VNAQPMKAFNGLILVVFGLLVFLAGFQTGGLFFFLGIPGLALVVAVIYDTIYKTPAKHLKAKRSYKKLNTEEEVDSA